MITADYHVHSDFSGDSQAPMELMIERAVQLGLNKICFTDHMDYDIICNGDISFIFEPEAYVAKLLQMKERYHKKITILLGIELGLQPHLASRLTTLMNSYPFDFAIGSSHVVDRIDPYFPEYWKDRTCEEGISAYFQGIVENCRQFEDFCVYGHLDYVIRYANQNSENKPDYFYSDYADLLDDALKLIIEKGKGIEVNTAGLKYGLGYPHPKSDILKRYLELGGEIITIGSDAHKPEHLCYDFRLMPDYLKSLGFRYYTTFENRKPCFEKL